MLTGAQAQRLRAMRAAEFQKAAQLPAVPVTAAKPALEAHNAGASAATRARVQESSEESISDAEGHDDRNESDSPDQEAQVSTLLWDVIEAVVCCLLPPVSLHVSMLSGCRVLLGDHRPQMFYQMHMLCMPGVPLCQLRAAVVPSLRPNECASFLANTCTFKGCMPC